MGNFNSALNDGAAMITSGNDKTHDIPMKMPAANSVLVPSMIEFNNSDPGAAAFFSATEEMDRVFGVPEQDDFPGWLSFSTYQIPVKKQEPDEQSQNPARNDIAELELNIYGNENKPKKLDVDDSKMDTFMEANDAFRQNFDQMVNWDFRKRVNIRNGFFENNETGPSEIYVTFITNNFATDPEYVLDKTYLDLVDD